MNESILTAEDGLSDRGLSADVHCAQAPQRHSATAPQHHSTIFAFPFFGVLAPLYGPDNAPLGAIWLVLHAQARLGPLLDKLEMVEKLG